MGKPITIKGLGEVDVDLWGTEFVTVPVTRSVRKKRTEQEQRLEALQRREADGADVDDEMVELLADGIDLRLKPKGNGRTKAGALIRRKWESDDLTLEQLFDFLERLGEADRPT